jgi:hypothetical protein
VFCLKWKLRKDQAAAAEPLSVVAALAWSLKWKECECEECGVLVAGDVLEPELGGEAGGSGGPGGATGGAVLAGVGGALVVDGPSGWSLGTEVQLYWNSGTVSSSPVKNL